MSYVKTDDAIVSLLNTVKGQNSVSSTFKMHLKYVQCYRINGHYFVLNGNLFIIFMCDSHSDAVVAQKYLTISLQWFFFIAEHYYKVKHILHLLDGFLTVDPPEFDAEGTMALMTMLFNRLNVPLAANKTMGPLTCIEYLGIVLDTDKLEARLPANKVEKICKFIISIIKKSTFRPFKLCITCYCAR